MKQNIMLMKRINNNLIIGTSDEIRRLGRRLRKHGVSAIRAFDRYREETDVPYLGLWYDERSGSYQNMFPEQVLKKLISSHIMFSWLDKKWEVEEYPHRDIPDPRIPLIFKSRDPFKVGSEQLANAYISALLEGEVIK